MPVPAGQTPTQGICTPWVGAADLLARPDMDGVTISEAGSTREGR